MTGRGPAHDDGSARSVIPCTASVDPAAVDDLRRRLRATRWPERETVDGWAQGVPLEWIQELCRVWSDDYDFGFADRLNAFEQFRTGLRGGGSDELDVHFLHVRSPEPDALALIVTHGWPGSVLEFLDVLSPLSDPRAHGADPADAFHLVVPSLPGFGWSAKPSTAGWGVARIARAWHELMARLGYDRFGAQGGDWGSGITTSLARQFPDSVAGIHVTLVDVGPDRSTLDDLTPTERQALDDFGEHVARGSGYSAQQSTRPQTLGYALTDSPAGQCAWIAEKYWLWTDHGDRAGPGVTTRQLLDEVSAYWFTASATSSARLYWESFGDRDRRPVTVPAGVTIFPGELYRPSRRWVERRYLDLRWYDEVLQGGHFAALEQPGLFVDQLRRSFRLVRRPAGGVTRPG